MLEVDGKFYCCRGGIIQSPMILVGGMEETVGVNRETKEEVGREGTVGRCRRGYTG